MDWSFFPNAGRIPFQWDFGRLDVDVGGNKLLLKNVSGHLDFDAAAETANIVFSATDCPVVDFKALGGWIRLGVPIHEIKITRAGIDVKHRYGTRHIDIDLATP